MHQYRYLLPSFTASAIQNRRHHIISFPGADEDPVVEHRLPVSARSRLESLFGCDLCAIRIYEGDLAMPIPCRAVTCGDSIYIQKGHYEPSCPQGLELLAHEITHVFQQRAGRLPARVNGGHSLIIDPALEAEAELIGRLAAISEAARPLRREEVLPDHLMRPSGETCGRAFQPVVFIQGVQQKYDDLWKRVSSHFNFQIKLWPRYDKDSGKTVSEPLTDSQKAKAAKQLKFWCDAPMSAKVGLNVLTGKTKGRAKDYDSEKELIRDLVGHVFVEEGIGRETEAKLAELIEKNNDKVSALLTEAVKRVNDSFHTDMMKNNAHYKEVLQKKERHYAWYYSSLLSKGGYLIGKAFSKNKQESPMKIFDANKLRSVESAFEYFLKAKQKIPSWMIVAFLCDYAKLAKEVYPDYFTSKNPDWWIDEAKWFARAAVESHLEELKKKAEQDVKDALGSLGGMGTLEDWAKMRLEEVKKEYFDQVYKIYEENIKKEAKEFKNFTKTYDHLFYRLPQMDARSSKTVSQFNVKHPWVKKATQHQVPLGNGPSASTTFLLAMLQIIYPHEETILAAALAIFEFWNRHYIQMQSDIHTWHEVMIAASPYVYNFDFQIWQKVDKKRDLNNPDAWVFEYPEIKVLQAWLTGKEKKELFTREKVSEIEKKIALQKKENRGFKIGHDTPIPDIFKNLKQ